MIYGGNIIQALNRIEVFSRIPMDLKSELFISTIGICDIFKRYSDILIDSHKKNSILSRALIKANSDKCNFYEQKRASGFSEEMIRKGHDIAVVDRYPELSFHCNECSGCTYELVIVSYALHFH